MGPDRRGALIFHGMLLRVLSKGDGGAARLPEVGESGRGASVPNRERMP